MSSFSPGIPLLQGGGVLPIDTSYYQGGKATFLENQWPRMVGGLRLGKGFNSYCFGFGGLI